MPRGSGERQVVSDASLYVSPNTNKIFIRVATVLFRKTFYDVLISTRSSLATFTFLVSVEEGSRKGSDKKDEKLESE